MEGHGRRRPRPRAPAAEVLDRRVVRPLRPCQRRSPGREGRGRGQGRDRDHQPLLRGRPRARHRVHLSRRRERPRVGGGAAARLGHRRGPEGDGGERAHLRQPLPHASPSRRRGAALLRRHRRLRHRHPAPLDARPPAARGGGGAGGRGRRPRHPPHPHHRRQHLRRADAARRARGRHRGRGRRLVLHLLPAVPLPPQPHPRLPEHRQPRRGRDRGQRRPRPGDGQLLPGRAARRRGAGRPRVHRPRPLLPLPLRERRRADLPRQLAALPALRRAVLPPPEPPAVPGGGLPARGREAAALADPVLAPSAVLRGADARQLEVQPRAPRAPVPARGREARPVRPRAQLPARARGRDRLLRHRRRRQGARGPARRAWRRRARCRGRRPAISCSCTWRAGRRGSRPIGGDGKPLALRGPDDAPVEATTVVHA